MKYIAFSYDDGTLHDQRLIELMNKYGIKGTFNLNSGLANYSWDNNGIAIVRPNLKDVIHLYDGHEIACHSLTHCRMDELDEEKLVHEVFDDKRNLEEIFKREIKGFAIPFDTCNEHVIDTIKKAGFSYCRSVEITNDTTHPEDAFHLKPTALTFRDDLLKVIDDFMSNGLDNDLCYIAGHSYEYYCNNNWDYIEKVFQKIKSYKNLKSVTTYEALLMLHKI